MFPPDLQNPMAGPPPSDTGGPPGPDALVGGPPGSPLQDTGGPPGPDALVGGPDAGGPPADTGGPPGPPGAGGGQPGVAEDPDFTRLVKMAIDALKQAQDTSEDDVDKQLAAECMAKLQGLMGTHQKQRESALGMTDTHRGVRRAIQSGGSSPGY